MENENLASALQRARKVLQRRPDIGLHDDAPAVARCETGTRVLARHPNGAQVATDMPRELGGGGAEVTPGWLFRAGMASCAATSIAMQAAMEGIGLESLEVQVDSRSDTRGIFGMTERDGLPVCAGARDLVLRVRLLASGVEESKLRALVEAGLRHSPIPSTVAQGRPLGLHIDIGAR